MALAAELMDQLKHELKSNGVTYKDVGEALEISESSVKRLFRDQDMSLSRLERICGLIELDIAGLAERCFRDRKRIRELNREQEEALVGDEMLFLIAAHIVYGWTFKRVMETYDIDEHTAQRHLTTLDRMKIIELQPGNETRVLLSPDFEWIKNGPIQAFYEDKLQGSFLQSDFTRGGELRLVINAWMSLENIEAFHENMRRFAREFESQKSYDKNTPPHKRLGTTLRLAIRPWELEMFEKYRRHNVSEKKGDNSH